MAPQTPLAFGIDAGATHTRAVLSDAVGSVLWQGQGAAGSVSLIGVDGSASLIAELLEEALGALSADHAEASMAPLFLCAGLAGARSPDVQERLADRLTTSLSHPEGTPPVVTVTHDAVIALHGAAGPDGAAAIVVSGTGSIVLVREMEGREWLAGGRGWPLGDEGSAVWLGWMAVRSALDQLESDRPGILCRAILEELGIDPDSAGPHDLIHAAGSGGRSGFGALAPIVTAHADRGVEEALDLVVAAGLHLGSQLAEACDRAGRQPGGSLPVYLLGALGRAAAGLLQPALLDGAGAHAAGLGFEDPLLPPVGGAVLLALGSAPGIAPLEGLDGLRTALAP